MVIREYRSSDCRETAELFYDTVHTVCAADYTPAQLDAWAPRGRDLAAWNESLLAHRSIVAVDRGEIVGFGVIVGFGDIHRTGYLDRLFVSSHRHGEGIGSAICRELEGSAPGSVSVRASITARPFFEKRGYAVVRREDVSRLGQLLTSYIMKK